MKYKDTYTDALRDVVKAQQRGHDVHELRQPEKAESPPDLREALRLSTEQSRTSRKATRTRSRAGR